MSGKQVIVLVCVIIIGVGALAAVIASSRDPRMMLVNSYDLSPDVFTFKYALGWQYRLLMQNLLMVAQPPTFEGEAGPTFTVQRSFPLSASDDLDEALQTYLNAGPLRDAGRWQVVDDIMPVIFGEREALALELEGREADDQPMLHTRIVITRAGNGAVYILSASAPLDAWAQHEAVLGAMLASVDIVE